MLILKKRLKQKGFTLTELLVTLTINLLLFSALITVFLANIGYYRKSVNSNRLNQQMQSAMTIMANDIRRAGYWGNAKNDINSDANNNPFMATGADISVNAGGDCILLTYDRNNDGTLPSITSASDDERYGYRLSNQTLQTRPPGAPFDCGTAANNWEDMTQSNFIQVTALSFTLNTSTLNPGPGTRSLLIRSVDISMTARLTNDPSITKTMSQRIRIRNDKFVL